LTPTLAESITESNRIEFSVQTTHNRLKQSKGRKRRTTGEAGAEAVVDPETGEITQP